MTLQQLYAILPLLVLSGGIVLLLLQVSCWRGHRGALATTLLVLAAAIYACFLVARRLQAGVSSVDITGLLTVDHTALFICLLMLLAGAVVAVLGFNYLKQRSARKSVVEGHPEEFYILLLLVLLGASTLVFASHFASFFLALELMSLALYPLLGFSVTGDRCPQREQMHSLESAIKYLLLSALSTALSLFGIALIYAASGALNFAGVAAIVAQTGAGISILLTGITLLLIGVAFKLSLVPFHIWTPDVYQGAPTPVTALIATVGKGAVIALMLRLFSQLDLFAVPSTTNLLAFMAIASMVVGNLLALMQTDIKRLLAYSSIAHIGYLIVAFMFSQTAFGVEAVVYYLVAYVVTTLGAFAVVSLVADAAFRQMPGGRRPISDAATDPFQQAYYRGLFWRSPWLACCLAAMLLSLAGIPLTIGFVGKFYIFAAGVQGELWLLLAAVVVGSALGLFYYLRLLLTMVTRDASPTETSASGIQIAVSGQLLLICLTAFLLVFGVFPQLLINWINAL